MKILLVHAPHEFARQLVQRNLDRDGVQVAVCSKENVFGLKSIEQDRNDEEPQHVPIHSRRKIDWGAIRALRRVIRSYQPDVVHAFLPRSLAQAVLACVGLRRKPRIVSFYGITRIPTWLDPANLITYLSPSVCMHACESNAVKESLVAGGVADARCEVVYNCVASSVVADEQQRRIEIRRELGVPEDSFLVGTVATIRPVKGIDIFMKAAITCSDISNVHFVVAGQLEDPVVAKLAEHPSLQGRLKMLGYVEGADEKMRAFDLFVMPSRREGLCRALLEAMERKICPIVSDAGGMKELVRHEIDGLVVPREDPQSLDAAIRKLYASRTLRDSYATSAHHRVRSICAPRVFSERMLSMYTRICA